MMEQNNIMRGFPPAAEAQVTLANWRKPPFNKWAFSHVREIIPSSQIKGAGKKASFLPQKPIDFSSISIKYQEQVKGWDEFIAETYTDDLVILHQGQLVYEYYRADLDAASPHILMSVSKSILGLIFGILAQQNVVKPEQLLCDWVPELQDSAYRQATLRDLLDMRAGVKFDEDYQATQGAIIAYRKAQGWDPINPHEKPDNLRAFFSYLDKADGQHGGLFHYVSPNTDLLGWVLERATTKPYADLVSQFLWQPMGAEEDAYITVDRLGAPRCAGGQCTTARDLARVGQILANYGCHEQTQIVPRDWIDDILQPANQSDLRQAWEKGDFRPFFGDAQIYYRNKWYVWQTERKILFGFGVFGQNLLIDFDTNTVIAKFSSQPLAVDPKMIGLTLVAAQTIGKHLAHCT